MFTGQIEMIVCRFKDIVPDRHPDGKFIKQLTDLQGEGVARLVDVLLVHKDEGGRITSMDMKGLGPSDEIEFGSIITHLIAEETAPGEGGPDEGVSSETGPQGAAARGDAQKFGGAEDSGAVDRAAEISYGLRSSHLRETVDQLASGETAALLMIEHSGAAGFQVAISEAGGEVAAQGFLTTGALRKVVVELEARLEALDALENSEENQREKAMKFLASAAAARAKQEEAGMRAAEMLLEGEIIAGDALDDAVRIIAEALRIEESLNEDPTS